MTVIHPADPVVHPGSVGVFFAAWDQSGWYIDGQNGNDSSDGATEQTPIRTGAELARRLPAGGAFTSPVTTIHILDDMVDGITHLTANVAPPGFLRILGRATATLLAATISGVTAIDPATQQRLRIAATGLGAHVGQRIRVDGGPRDGAISWVAEADGADAAFCSPMAVYDPLASVPAPATETPVTPQAGDDIVVEQLVRLPSLYIPFIVQVPQPASYVQGVCDSVHITGGALSDSRLAWGATFDTYVTRSKVDAYYWDSASFVASCMGEYFGCSYDGQVNRRIWIRSSLFLDPNNGKLLTNAGTSVAMFDTLFQGGGISLDGQGRLEAAPSTHGLAVFDAPARAIELRPMAELAIYSPLWGNGNGTGLDIQKGAKVWEKIAATGPQNITGNSSEIRIAGTGYTWAQMPVFESANSAGHLGVVP